MNWEKFLLDMTKYEGPAVVPHSKTISASQITAPLLQRWLAWNHGVPEQNEIGVNTIGSLVHKAIEYSVIKLGENIEAEKECELELENGWKLTGTADIVDHINKEIIDIKMVKQYRIEKLVKAATGSIPWEDEYIIQLNAYREMIGSDYRMSVMALSPDAGYDHKKKTVTKPFRMVKIPNIGQLSIEKAFEATNELQEWIDIGETPPRCPDVWERKGIGPMRCMIYCNYKEVCPYFKPSNNQIMKSWGF